MFATFHKQLCAVYKVKPSHGSSPGSSPVFMTFLVEAKPTDSFWELSGLFTSK